jgi:hypothetical protein
LVSVILGADLLIQFLYWVSIHINTHLGRNDTGIGTCTLDVHRDNFPNHIVQNRLKWFISEPEGVKVSHARCEPGHVTVTNATDAAEMRFACDDWLNTKQPLKVWRRSEVYACPAEQLRLVEGTQGVYQYKVAFTTGTSLTAGTDSSLKLTLVGEAEEVCFLTRTPREGVCSAPVLFRV